MRGFGRRSGGWESGALIFSTVSVTAALCIHWKLILVCGSVYSCGLQELGPEVTRMCVRAHAASEVDNKLWLPLGACCFVLLVSLLGR